jgi:hypothetical protein
MPPTAEFSALSIAPLTPTRRRHSRESSASSLESTPEEGPESDFFSESLSFGVPDFDLPFEDAGSPLLHHRRLLTPAQLPPPPAFNLRTLFADMCAEAPANTAARPAATNGDVFDLDPFN